LQQLEVVATFVHLTRTKEESAAKVAPAAVASPSSHG
jgi:hypothetical protein